MIDRTGVKQYFSSTMRGWAHGDQPRLKVSRNAVRVIIKQGGAMPDTVRDDKINIDTELLSRLIPIVAALFNGYTRNLLRKRGSVLDIPH